MDVKLVLGNFLGFQDFKNRLFWIGSGDYRLKCLPLPVGQLDQMRIRGIDDDPVRQSLAAAIVAFAADVGAVVVSEGIESESELACLRGLAVGLGQGFFLGRPGMGAMARSLPEPV